MNLSPPGFLLGKVRNVAVTVQNITAVFPNYSSLFLVFLCFLLFRAQYSLHNIGNGDWALSFLCVFWCDLLRIVVQICTKNQYLPCCKQRGDRRLSAHFLLNVFQCT